MKPDWILYTLVGIALHETRIEQPVGKNVLISLKKRFRIAFLPVRRIMYTGINIYIFITLFQ